MSPKQEAEAYNAPGGSDGEQTLEVVESSCPPQQGAGAAVKGRCSRLQLLSTEQ